MRIAKRLVAILAFFVLAVNTNAYSQKKVNIILLANDKIADVNIDKDDFIEKLKPLVDLVDKFGSANAATQKTALLYIAQKSGKPVIKVYTNPVIAVEKSNLLVAEAEKLPYSNTKIMDMPIMLTYNTEQSEYEKIFSEAIEQAFEKNSEFKKANFTQQYLLLKQWAIEEALPVLTAYEVNVEDKFAGVKNFGKLIQNTDFKKAVDIANLTDKNPDYWRAILEMNVGNQLIPATRIMMHISQGEFDYASKYLQIANYFSDDKTVAGQFLNEAKWRLKAYTATTDSIVESGIRQHDNRHPEEAIKIYNTILNTDPKKAWALYEKYYSQNAIDIEQKNVERNSRTNWDMAKKAIYTADPLYEMDVRAANAREGYLLFRRYEMKELFKKEDQLLSDVEHYADISLDLGVNDFAGLLYWYAFTFSKENSRALNRFLYTLEKLNNRQLKENFKGDFEKIFKSIDEERDKEMKENSIYKSFKE